MTVNQFINRKSSAFSVKNFKELCALCPKKASWIGSSVYFILTC